jgi:hypothetical protein
MKSFSRLNNIGGWLTFVLSGIVYLLTLEPTVSFWDCGEFIASSYRLQIGHPPGAPFFLLTQRIMSLFAPGTQYVAFTMNAFSALASAATVMFLFWTITMLAKKLVSNPDTKQQWLILIAGFTGAITFAFTDTFWFSAVETEVYAYSSLFTALVFWAMLKWEAVANQPYANRWIVLIAYLTGLSIGVHLLNLLAIPAIALIWYYKKYKPSLKGFLATLVISGAMVAFIMWGVIQGTARFAINLEVFLVNQLNLPYKSGILLFLLLIAAICIVLMVYARKKQKPLLNLAMVSVLLIYLGFTSYAMISIRSASNPPMDQNNPQDAVSLMKYLNREQYGQTPLLSGYHYNAPITGYKPPKTEYFAKDGRYIKVEGATDYRFDERFKTFFPRMYSSSAAHESAYKSWANIKGRPVNINNQTEYIPTFAENLRFFFSYQVNHMYVRYFLWNFSGRQNDIQGYGDPYNGNWLTGIGFIDKMRIGHNGKQPASMANPKTMNRYFLLPFLLGLAGLLFQYRKKQNDFWVVMLLFFMTGLAIVIFLNQTPYQPRERDYAYAGSYYAFAIWIGLGVMALATYAEKITRKSKVALPAALLTIGVPILVFAQNYDDHDRSDRYMARELGMNYLRSCEPNAILFTYGDNDTFPLWYAQDVEGFRTDVRVCNVTLLNAGWYINQMKLKTYESAPLPLRMASEKYEHNKRNIVFIQETANRPVELSQLLTIALSDDDRAKVMTQGGEKYNFMPSRLVKIPVDIDQVIATGTVSADKRDQIADSMVFELKGSYITKSDLAILDMLANNNWERPIYFDLSVVQTTNIKIERYLQHEGFAFRFVPIINQAGNIGSIDTDILYERLMNQFQWGNMDKPGILVDDNLQRTVEVAQIRQSFIRLADQLLINNDSLRCIEVLDRLYELLPFSMYKNSSNDLYSASLYFKTNKPDKANLIIDELTKKSFEKADFYLSMGSSYVNTFQGEITRERNILQSAVELATQNGHVEKAMEIQHQMETLLGDFAR